jgi:hypothetical protein
MAVLQKYRMLFVVYAITLVFGTREYLISRNGGMGAFMSGCQASAASCPAEAVVPNAFMDSTFWAQHADMAAVVAQINPDDPDTEFLLGMQALADGDNEQSIEHLEAALAYGVKHNNYLLQYYAQYELSRGGDWRRVNLALNRWRTNHPFAAEPLTVPLGAGPASASDEADLRRALDEVPWISGAALEAPDVSGTQQWRLLITFMPGEVVDMRQAVEAITILSVPPEDRRRLRVRCATMTDCNVEPRR